MLLITKKINIYLMSASLYACLDISIHRRDTNLRTQVYNVSVKSIRWHISAYNSSYSPFVVIKTNCKSTNCISNTK